VAYFGYRNDVDLIVDWIDFTSIYALD
jgi:hypothetical protein